MDWIAPDPVALHARGRPMKLACVDLPTGRRWTYAELDATIERGVAALAGALGVGPGDRIAVLAKNSADLLILQQAAMRLGAIVAPLNWRLAPAELAPILADCAPVLLVGDGTVAVDPPSGAARLPWRSSRPPSPRPAPARAGRCPRRTTLA